MPFPATYLGVSLLFVNDATQAQASCRLFYLPQSSGAFNPSLANITTFANGFRTAYLTAGAAALTTNCRIATVRLRWVSGSNEVEGDNNNGAITGSVTGETLPEEDVIVIHRRTGLIGRRNRGRIFWPFVPEVFSDEGGELTALGLTAAAGLAAMVKSPVTSNAVAFDPYTIDFKDGIARQVVQSGYLTSTASRRDRRFPKRLIPVRV